MSKIIVIGASGFIGSHITAHLKKRGSQVIAAVRNVAHFNRRFPDIPAFECDFNTIQTPFFWDDHLNGIDVVINTAGVLHDSYMNNIDNVHFNGPAHLLKASIKAQVKRFIHISALGIDTQTSIAYASTKNKFDHLLMQQTDIDWVILKPSLVYGEEGSKGTALFKQLASLPYFIPLIGDGDQQFQPVYIDDLVAIIAFCAFYKNQIKKCFDIVGPDSMKMKEILTILRQRMGKPKAKFLHIPVSLIAAAAKCADFFCKGSLISTSYKMMQYPNIGQYKPIVSFTGITPRKF